MTITITTITTHREMTRVEQLEKEIWGVSDLEVTCVHSLHALVHNGGSLLGAYDGGELVGFVLGIPALTADAAQPLAARLKLYSYMAGVLAAYQGQGVGRQLKLAQREEALRQGFRLITWMYDPLESVNAHLNVGKLGAVCRTYHRHFHGDMGGINAGLPTDRFEVEWRLESGPVVEKVKGEKRPLSLQSLINQGAVLLNPAIENAAGLPVPPEAAAIETPLALIEIPTHFRAIKQQDPALAETWRFHSRQLFEKAFALGYGVTDFVYDRDGNGRFRACYVVNREQ